MEENIGIAKGRQDIPRQTFNGKVYRRHKGERYFSHGCHRMHRDVWSFYNGPVPEGHEIHHVDFDTSNNSIENLVCLSLEEHRRVHRERFRAVGLNERQRQHLDEIRPLTAGWHRSEEGRKWHSEHARESFARREPETYTCKMCGKEFQSKLYHSLFCSNACKSRWRRKEGLDDIVCICAECGREFTTNRYSKARCCSAGCAARHRWRERKERESI